MVICFHGNLISPERHILRRKILTFGEIHDKKRLILIFKR